MKVIGCRPVLLALAGFIVCLAGRDVARAQVNE